VTEEIDNQSGSDQDVVRRPNPPEEQGRIQRLSDLQEPLERCLDILATDAERANALTYGTLFELALITDDISTSALDARLDEPGQRIRSLLPLSDEELGGLTQRMKGYEDPKVTDDSYEWYKNANEADIVLLERWRRWLIDTFHEQSDDLSSQGQELITAVGEVGKVLDDII
jgi:hypothetical protein